jgi:hypothetical protein
MAQSFKEKAHLNTDLDKYSEGYEKVFGKKKKLTTIGKIGELYLSVDGYFFVVVNNTIKDGHIEVMEADFMEHFKGNMESVATRMEVSKFKTSTKLPFTYLGDL